MAEPMQCTEEDALSHDGFVENGQENGSESGRYISDTEMEDRQAESEAQRSQESPRCSQLPLSRIAAVEIREGEAGAVLLRAKV